MEMFPNLRRISKRSLLCLYFACATFLACAIYTFYVESHDTYSAVVYNNALTDSVLRTIDKELLENDSIGKIPLKDDIVAVPSAPRTFSLSNFASIRTDSNSTFKLHSKSSKLGTKYIYIDTSPSNNNRSSQTLNSAFAKAITSSSLAPDTCRTFSTKDSKLILLWTPFFQEWDYFQDKRLLDCRRCRNCRITNNRTLLAESDAVIFHARDMSLSDLPSIRYPHQKWIFYCLESPPYSDFPGMDYMANMFNWTMTYRLDSDIITQYGTIKRVRPPRKLDEQSLQMSFNKKTRSVVWMSSHCPTHGGRDDYVKELRGYIDVDIYGSCGSFYCPPNGTEKCLRNFASRYKFFLAFENTICKDYVTEKFFRTLEYNMIPVVFGGASYSKFAPPGSYIDALSFKSPKHLAYFLAGVAKDFKIYSTYLRWRQDYVIEHDRKKECDLCNALHKNKAKQTSYANLRAWWIGGGECKTWKPKS